MKILLLPIFLLGAAHAHLLEGVPASLTVTYKNGNSVTLATKDDKLVKAEVTLNGKVIEVPKNDLSDIEHPNLQSVKILETDTNKAKQYRLELKYSMPPDVHGSIDDDAAHVVASFHFSEERYGTRTIKFVLAKNQQTANKAEMATPRKPSD